MFQTGAILGRHFASTPEPFFVVYSVEEGHEKDGPEYIYSQVKQEVVPFVADATSFNDLVVKCERVGRYNDTGPEDTFVIRQMSQKVKLDAAYRYNWEWALNGAGFGVMYPDAVVELYNLSHAALDPDSWRRAHEDGRRRRW